MQRFLTQREAERCEMAQEPVCKCRCGGEKHGAGRIGKGGDFSALPIDDPHYRPPMTKIETIRFLQDATMRCPYPHVFERDDYVQKFGWDAWYEEDRRMGKAYLEAQDILRKAIENVKAR